ncbi:MAG: glycosyltransferase [Acidimicrobiales bacterium]
MSGGVLWVTAEVPDREGGGGNQRQAYLLQALADLVPVDLLVVGQPRDKGVTDAVRRLVAIPRPEPEPRSRMRGRTHAAVSAWVHRTPLDVDEQTPLRNLLGVELRTMSTDVDAVLVHHQSLGPLLTGPRRGRARWVASFFHAAGVRSEQAAAVETRALQRALLRRDGANSARFERQIIDVSDALVVITSEDAERLRRSGTPVHVVPMGIDLDAFRPGPLPPEPTVLLTGSFDYPPNVDGAVWFASAVWPRVRAEVHDAKLLVVGRQPAAVVAALDGHDGIEVHPDVPAIAPWLARARVSVVPMRVGTGVRVKAIQSLAAGCPVVGTPIGMEGLGLGPHEACITAEPGCFAEGVIALLRDDALAEARRAAGRRHAERQCSWAHSGALLKSALLGAPGPNTLGGRSC